MRRLARVAFYVRVGGVASVRACGRARGAAGRTSGTRACAATTRLARPRRFPPTFSRPPNTASFNFKTHENWIHEDRSVRYLSDTCDFCV